MSRSQIVVGADTVDDGFVDDADLCRVDDANDRVAGGTDKLADACAKCVAA